MKNLNENKFIKWLKSSRSDFVLLTVVLILLNLVGLNSYFRIDLTSPQSYSLSKSSRQLVKNLEEPLCIKVFFSKNLPAPYNTTEQYLRDLLIEYKGSANRNFSYEFYNMNKEENQRLANQYGIHQKQIQEVKDNEVGFKNVYMGLAIVYADSIEALDVTDPSGLEYRITTTVSKMINTTSSLAGLKGKVNCTLYYSKELSAFGINGFNKLENSFNSACEAVNKKNLDKLKYSIVYPDEKTITLLGEKYGADVLTWNDKGTEKQGVICALIEYGNNFRLLPVGLTRGFFGSYSISGLDALEENLSDSLASLVSKSDSIGYLTGFGCRSLTDEKAGSAVLNGLVSDRYEFYPLDLQKDEIPASIDNIVINGPTEKISKEVFYKLDQFLMRGGNLTVFADSFKEIPSENQYSLPSSQPLETGLPEFLESYGIKINADYVLDKQCYEAFQQGYGKIPLYYVPIVERNGLSQKNPISKNLSYVLTVQNSSIYIETSSKKMKVTSVLKSSKDSWKMKDNIILHPMYITVPQADEMGKENLAVLLEGKFKSQFTKEDNPVKTSAKTSLNGADNFRSESVKGGKIFVMGTSLVTTSNVIDEQGSEPIGILVRNVMDYMNGNPDLCTMRTKGLGLNTLRNSNVASVRTAKIFNQYVIPALIILLGFIAWRARKNHRRKILAKYANSDERETLEKEEKRFIKKGAKK